MSTIRLPLHLKQMGSPENCGHRSGWRFAMDHLRRLHDPTGPLVDDFVERTFQHQDSGQSWREPWVGIFHHPPGLPAWLDQTALPSAITALPLFLDSLPLLRGAVALSEYLGSWLRSTLKVPVLVLKHPTEIPALKFSIEEWESSSVKSIVQIGWYARNYRAIYQLDVPEQFRKIRLLQNRPWVNDAAMRVDALSPFRQRKETSPVVVINRLDDANYDVLMTKSVVFCEYFDVSASNTIIECMARNTPIIVNRLPALEEYLGRDYPLFFDDIRDVPRLLAHPEAIHSAHSYLASLNKEWMCGKRFARKLLAFTHQVMSNASVRQQSSFAVHSTA